MDEAKTIEMIKKNPIIIKNIDNPTEEMKLIAINKNGLLLRYINNPTLEMQEIAMNNNPRAIEFIENPTEKMMIEAVNNGWSNLNYIKNPSYNVIKLAIEQRGWAIRYVKEPSEELQLLAVMRDYDSIKYIKEHYGSAEIQKQNQANKEKENIGLVYDLQGVRGRYMKVYQNRAVIGVKATIGSLFSGNVSDGEKTIYYRDCIGVQFKESGLQIGYLQLETASGIMNNKQSNFFNENSFTFDTTVQTNEKMIEVANYVRSKVEEAKSGEGQTIIKEVSAADEIKKFKELLDMGVITQEEFDAKKKQLLGL